MNIPVFTNRRAAGTQSVRQSITKRETDLMTPALGNVQDRLNALATVKEKQAESEGVSEYLKWNEAAAAKKAELSDRNGSNAVNLAEDFDAWNDEYVANMQFSSREAERTFNDRMSVTSSDYRKNLNVYEVAESVEFNNQIKEAEYTNGMNDSLTALTSGDMLGYSWGKARAEIAFKELHAGEPEEYVDTLWKESNDKVTSQLATNMVKAGNVEEAFAAMSQSNSFKDVSDITYDTFKLMNKSALAESRGKARVDATINDSDVVYYTNEEWAQKNGIDTSTMPEEERLMNSGYARNYIARVNMAENILKSKDYEDNTYFEGDNQFNRLVDDFTQSSIATVRQTKQKEYDDSIQNVVSSAKDDIAQYEATGDVEALAAFNEKTQELEANDEWNMVNALKGHFEKTITTNPEVYNTMRDGVRTGAVTARQINENMHLNIKEKNSLITMMKNQEKDNYKNAEKMADSFVRDYLDISRTKKVAEMSFSDQLKYYQYSNAVTGVLNDVYTGEPIKEEDVMSMVEGAISSNKFDIDEIDNKYIENTIYDVDSDRSKAFIQKNNISEDEYLNLVQVYSVSGNSAEKTFEVMQNTLDAERDLEMAEQRQFRIDKFGKDIRLDKITIESLMGERGGVVESAVAQAQANEMKLEDMQRKIRSMQKLINIRNRRAQ